MLVLMLTAELTGVTDLTPVDTPESPYFYTFKVVCTSCREEHDKWVGISRHEQNTIPNSRGEANFVWRCKNCKRESTANITEAPAYYAASDVPKAQKIITLDCRGCEFTDFKPDGEWMCKGTESGTKFDGAILEDEDGFYDYDEKAGDEVSVKEVRWEIKKA